MSKEKDILKQLAAPFTIIDESGTERDAHKWKPSHFAGKKVVCVPYIDKQQAEDRLDEVFGLGWSNTLIEVSGIGMLCEITALIENREITRSNLGAKTDGKSDKEAVMNEKARATDAIKRAATMFGVGRYLDDIEPITLPMVVLDGKKYAGTESGKALITGNELTSYINLKNPLRAKLIEIYKSLPKQERTRLDKEFELIGKALV